ncbi:hypothetical protein L8C07_10420 [Paenibacillus sp. CMAA1739]|uniref:hypothetical protein n=1 Tax=Paenibacillus ottowii TaxID=2315729 RepID=UPI00272FCC1E|nr:MULTISPECIES: hypothetical protein [Paenibacillus]MDP1511147.1 hypothetical protein [Paenibacillus ottowii]MEC4566355.1 hypothetical protein [Paenibacillus sp. CMAA1739]
MISSDTTQHQCSLVKSYLLLTFIQKVFERDSLILEESGVLKTPDLYVEMVNAGIDRTGILLSEIKHEFKKYQIRVLDIQQNHSGVHATYIYKSAKEQFSMPMPAFRKEMYERMRAYLGLPTSMPHTAALPLPEKYRPEPNNSTPKPLRVVGRSWVTSSSAYKHKSSRPTAFAASKRA